MLSRFYYNFSLRFQKQNGCTFDDIKKAINFKKNFQVLNYLN